MADEPDLKELAFTIFSSSIPEHGHILICLGYFFFFFF